MFAVGLALGVSAYTVVYNPPVTHAQSLSKQEEAELRAEYDKLQEEIAEWQKVLDETKAKKNTLQGDVTVLNAQIKKAEAEIKQRNGTINKLAGEINDKVEHISELEEKLEQGRSSLAQLIREKHEMETTPLAVMLLSAGDLSSFFATVDAIDVINRDLQAHFDELRGVKQETEKEKEQLDAKKNQELDARYEVEVKKQQVKKDEVEKQRLLDITKKDEASYAQVLAERQQRAAEIYARLFPLRDTEGIQFGEAVAYAEAAASKTGVRAVLILAILSQESDLGKNVGNCYVTNSPNEGDGVGKNTGRPFVGVMHPTRDVPVFKRLTEALGKDWRTTPVSCPIASAGGWGGAMGPTQFIPSTWITVEDELKRLLNISATNPWNAQHAINATAIYLARLGANVGGYTAEHTAAAKYYAGSGWATRGQTYANQVMTKVTAFARDIETLDDL